MPACASTRPLAHGHMLFSRYSQWYFFTFRFLMGVVHNKRTQDAPTHFPNHRRLMYWLLQAFCPLRWTLYNPNVSGVGSLWAQ